MTEAKSAQPQLPPRPETIPAVYFGNDSIQVYGVGETDAYMDALEAENESLKAQLEQAQKQMGSIEMKDHLQTIDERDRAEEALSQVYYLIKGESPEWSNNFGFDEIVEAIDDAQKCFRTEIKILEAECDKALKLIREYRKNIGKSGRDHHYCRKTAFYPGLGAKDDRCPTCIKADTLLKEKS